MFQQMEGCFSFPFKLLVSLRTYLWSRSCEFSSVDGIREIGVSLEYLFAEILSTVINSVFYTLGSVWDHEREVPWNLDLRLMKLSPQSDAHHLPSFSLQYLPCEVVSFLLLSFERIALFGSWSWRFHLCPFILLTLGLCHSRMPKARVVFSKSKHFVPHDRPWKGPGWVWTHRDTCWVPSFTAVPAF